MPADRAGRDFDRSTTRSVAVVEQRTADDLDVAPRSPAVGASTDLLAAGMVLLVSASTLGVSWWTRRRTRGATPAATLR
jgi:hypothetical protein